jgi:hypothetical protein
MENKKEEIPMMYLRIKLYMLITTAALVVAIKRKADENFRINSMCCNFSVVYFRDIYYYTSNQNLRLRPLASIQPHKQTRLPCCYYWLCVENYYVWSLGGLQRHNLNVKCRAW